MVKKLLYLSDLYNYFVSQNKNVRFSSKDDDTTIVVHIDEPFTYSKTEDDELNMYCPIRLCHTLTNANKSHISNKTMKDAIPTAYNMPILGYIYKDDNDEYQFAGHEFFMNEDNELVYEEQPCGVIPESADLKLVDYDGDEKSYLEGIGIIWRTYSKASEIIEREKELSVSVELMVDELSFDAKNKELVIEKFRFSGVTILGKDRYTGEEIKPGMVNSEISISDFSETNNSIFSQNERVIKLLSELNEKLDGLNIDNQNSKEGGNEPLKKEFDEQAEKEIKETPSTENFDGEESGDGTDDGVDYYGDPGDGAEDGNDKGADDDEPNPELSDDDEPEPTPDPEPSGDDDEEDDGVIISDDDEDGKKKKKTNEYSVTVSHGEETKTFALSLQDKIEALYTLVNDTYAEADGCYYDCTVYDEDKYVIMSSWWTGDAYKQSYKVKKDVYSLVGDRVRVKAVYVTEDEEKALENMRANYSVIETELAQYKAEPEKLEVINSAAYAQIKDSDAFKKLAERDTYFSMTVDEVRAEADKMLLEFAKTHKIEFSSEEPEKKQVDMKRFNPSKKATKSKSSSRYGGLFSK